MEEGFLGGKQACIPTKLPKIVLQDDHVCTKWMPLEGRLLGLTDLYYGKHWEVLRFNLQSDYDISYKILE